MPLNLIMTLKQVERTITVILLSPNSISRLLYQQNVKKIKVSHGSFSPLPLFSCPVVFILLCAAFIPT